MAVTVDSVIVELSAKVEKHNRDINAAAANFDGKMKQITASASRMERTTSAAFTTLKGAALGFVASLGVEAIVKVAKAGLEYAASLGEIAESLGVSTKFLQEFRYAASQNGASIEQADNALGKFSVTIGKALDGEKSAVEAFTKLGISIESLNRASEQQRFDLVADAIKKIPDPARQSAAAIEIFGRGARAIIPTLTAGAEAFKRQAAEAREYGLVLSDEQIQNADKTADKIDRLTKALQTKIAGVVADNAREIGLLADALADVAVQAIKAASSWLQWQRAQARTIEIRDQNRGAETVAEGFGFRLKRNTRRALPKGGRGGGRSASGSQFRIAADLPEAPKIDLSNRGSVSGSSGGGGSRSRSRGIARDLKEADPVARQLADTMADISREAADVGQSIRQDWNDGGQDFKDVITDVNARMDDERQVRLDDLREAHDLQEMQIRDLAGLYEELFTGGTKGFLKVLKYEGIRVISDILARLTQGQSLSAAVSGGGGNLFSSLFSAGVSLFGRASGGAVSSGRLYRVNETGIEGFRPAQSGTIVPLGQMSKMANAAPATQPAVVQIMVDEGAAFVPRVQAISGEVSVQVVRLASPGLVDASVNETFRRGGRPKL